VNIFASADNVTELIMQVCGAASTCWIGGTGSIEFDTAKASSVADQAIDRLIELGWAAPEDRKRRDVLSSVHPQQKGGVV
jgi:hypothetical protein